MCNNYYFDGYYCVRRIIVRVYVKSYTYICI